MKIKGIEPGDGKGGQPPYILRRVIREPEGSRTCELPRGGTIKASTEKKSIEVFVFMNPSVHRNDE